MPKATVQAVLDWIDGVAPFDTQEEFDNAGLLAGSPEREVTGILVCLDVTDEVIREAKERSAGLIVAHHPLIFTPLKSLSEQGYVAGLLAKLVRADISLIAAHTNMDKSADFSASAAIARALGLEDVLREGDYVFAGSLPQPMRADALRARITAALGGPVLRFGNGDAMVRTLAVAGGAYSEGFGEALAAGAQAFVTGEVRHHHAVEAVSRGLVVYEAGHAATELMMVGPLAEGLQKAMEMLQYPVRVHASRSAPYRIG